MTHTHDPSSWSLDRRQLLVASGAAAGISWLTPVARLLADEAERLPSGQPAQSIVVLWMAGGPSQLETFDPHPGTAIGGQTKAIRTAAADIQLADGLERTAERMQSLSLVRSLTSKEGDHQRGTYLMKTGYRPDPTVVHPSIGAIVCKELPIGQTDIPRHVAILPGSWYPRGGYLGDQYDAFKAYDPVGPVPDVSERVPDERGRQRRADLAVVERSFARGRERRVAATLHDDTVRRAERMMTSDQLQAFDVSHETAETRGRYGATPFGRGCLAARRLIERGVRCVEVTLDGWDTHANNHELCRKNKAILDPALAALVGDLQERGLWQRTIVLCGGEFGRTPTINPVGGRDHWPHGFSVAIGGGGLRGGAVVGATDPAGGREVHDPRQVGDLHATILAALGIDPAKQIITPIGRPLKLADGKAMRELLKS